VLLQLALSGINIPGIGLGLFGGNSNKIYRERFLQMTHQVQKLKDEFPVLQTLLYLAVFSLRENPIIQL
jgi:hypothetical protein